MSATTTANIGAATPSETLNDLLYEAMLALENALTAGLQLQENSVKLWRDLLARSGSLQVLQDKLDTLADNLFPAVRKRLEELVETSTLSLMLANRTSSQTLNLLNESLNIYQAGSVPEAQRRTCDWIDSVLSTVHENVPIILNTNVKILSSWTNLANWTPSKIYCAFAPINGAEVHQNRQ